MLDYMAQVIAHLHAIHSWVQSGEYAQLSRAVDDALSGMRRSFSAFLAQMDNPPVMPPVTGSTSQESTTHHKMSSSQSSMDSLLNILSQHQFAHSSSLPEADRVMLERNFNPLISSEDYPYQHPAFYACMRDSGNASSPSTTAYSGSPRPSLKGKERCLYEDDDSTHSTIPTSTTFANGLPDVSVLSPVPPPSPSAPLQLRAGVKRRRSYSESYLLSKRQRVSVQRYGVDGCLSDCSTQEATLAQVPPHVGLPVPLHPRLSPSTLPPPSTLWPSHPSIAGSRSVSAPADIASSSAGPSSSRSSASRSPSPPLSVGDGLSAPTPYGGVSVPPAPFRSTSPSPFGSFSLPLPPTVMDDWSLDSQLGFTTASSDADTCSNASDSSSEFEAASYVTAPDFAEDEDEMDASAHSEDRDTLDCVPSVSMDVDVDASPSRPVTVPAKTTGTIKRRRCLEGLLHTIRQMFRART